LCTKCAGSAINCSDCIVNDGVKLIGNQCKCNTDDGYYIYNNPISGKDECKKCHRLCKQCHGDTNTECDLCRNEEVNNLDLISENKCKCKIGYFDDNTKIMKPDYCQPCGKFCSECTVSPNNCQSCIDNPGIMKIGSSCQCKMPRYFEYFNSTLNSWDCIKCHPLCSECNGPLNSQCSACDLNIGAILVNSNTCECPSHYYFDIELSKCTPCDLLCDKCFGPNSNQCIGCNSEYGFNVIDQENVCTADCLSFGSYYLNGTICESIFFIEIQ